AEQDRRVVAITAAMAKGTGLTKFRSRFPDRFFDVGIAEQHAVALAAGLARQGARPVVAIYSTFLQRAYDQFIHDVCIQDLPVVFALDRAGIVGDDGKTQQGVFDYSYMRCIPNVVLMAPKDENELQHMLHTALHHDGPIAVRYPRGAALGVTLDAAPQRLPIGKAEVLRRGPDVALLGIGLGVEAARQAAEHLATEGVSATVVNARFVKPLDRDLILELARSVGRLVTIEENALAGGFGSAVWELLEHEGVHDCRLHRVGVPDEFVEHGPQASWRKRYGLDATGVAAAVQQHFPELFRPDYRDSRRVAVVETAPSKRQRATEAVGAR
ncbi:MAG TPA: transketolase C-terminal domain-containing protein, partial [Chloroflexota bacterium]